MFKKLTGIFTITMALLASSCGGIYDSRPAKITLTSLEIISCDKGIDIAEGVWVQCRTSNGVLKLEWQKIKTIAIQE